jgi:hypothetical protein
MATVRREVSDRTIFGKIAKWLFILFNLFMIYAVVAGVGGAASNAPPVGDGAAEAGHAIGTAIGVTLLLGFWTMGDIILGLLVLFTRRKKIIESEE